VRAGPGQVACAEKSNEITAIPELLRLVDIQGTIITIDAMGTQKAIAAQIVDSGADYVLALKGNQESLHQAVIDYVNEEAANDFADVKARRHITRETGHGREETRVYLQLPVPADLPGIDLWKGLRSLGMATLMCVRNGKETIETRYYISSLEVGVKRFAHAVRSHWGIENSCHWSLDMTYREDESRLRGPHIRQNFAWLNRFTLSLLKQHPGKRSIVGKRRGCGWSDDFLTEVLTGETL
jgi:predicted transposase YbfD/YdcC